MATAWASLLSLMNLIELIQRHPDPPVPLDPRQAESLSRIIGSLQRFLEDSHSRGLAAEVRGLERRIAAVAHAAEDVIESHVVRKIVGASASTDLYKTLQGAIRDMEFVEEEVKRTSDKLGGVEDDDHRPRRSSLLVPPLRSSSLTYKTSQIVVGFDEISMEIMDRMTVNQRKLDVFALVGMGGIGKTTLARSIYESQLIVDWFEVRLWVTISQQWSTGDVLTVTLRRGNHESEVTLDDHLYQSIIGKRYLLVMDDFWSIGAWDEIKRFFPDKNNGSRIIITTRLSEVASVLARSPNLVNVDFLDEDRSWDLFCRKVFADGSCPLELEEIGRKIARKCGGLPLSIVTIGGLLAKSDPTREHLEYVAQNLSSLVNSEGGDHSLKILSLSYVHLPVHLKPCFLYMGLFPEDAQIVNSHLIRLWIIEGLVKSINGKALEEIGEDYLKDLVGRNLVSYVPKHSGYCFIHDLLRDLCIREAREEHFFSVVKNDSQQGDESNDTQRRIAIHRGTLNLEDSSSHSMPYTSPFLRTCIIDSRGSGMILRSLLRPVQHRLISILAGIFPNDYFDADEIVPLVNLRFLSAVVRSLRDLSFILSTHWSLQIINVSFWEQSDAPQLDIWKMSEIRHVEFLRNRICLSYPPRPSSVERLVVLENLQTLDGVLNFECSEEVVKRIPNIKILKTYYSTDNNVGRRTSKDCCLDNLGRLEKLETLHIVLSPIQSDSNWLDGLTLPSTLKNLYLFRVSLDNEIMGTVIGGSVPHLQELILSEVSFAGDEWNPVEGQFSNLKTLELDNWCGLKHWNANNTHFQRLEHLFIASVSSLEEFPSGIGDIDSLRSIKLYGVSNSVVVSAKQMQVAQEEEFENHGIEIQVHILFENLHEVEHLKSKNFKIYSYSSDRIWC